jgi:hypothetical protein
MVEIGRAMSLVDNFVGFSTPDGRATLTIICRLESGLMDYTTHTFLNFFFRPLPLRHETSLIMGLFTADESKGGEVRVRAMPVEGDRDTALLNVPSWGRIAERNASQRYHRAKK